MEYKIVSESLIKKYEKLVSERTLAAPSILSGDFGALAESAQRAQSCGADFIHVDVMDGHFVPNLTFGPDVVKALKRSVSIPLDVHLMISRPDVYAEKFIDAGADIVTVHKESDHDLKQTLNMIAKAGAVPGVVLNPDTEIDTILDVLPLCRMILVMSVFPGFGGQAFISDVLRKVEKLKEIRDRDDLDFWIEIDGGINRETSADAFKAGADILVAGSYIFGKEDIQGAVDSLKIKK